MKLGIAAGKENGVGRRVGRLIAEGGKEGNPRAAFLPGNGQVRIEKPECHIAGYRDMRSKGRYAALRFILLARPNKIKER